MHASLYTYFISLSNGASSFLSSCFLLAYIYKLLYINKYNIKVYYVWHEEKKQN